VFATELLQFARKKPSPLLAHGLQSLAEERANMTTKIRTRLACVVLLTGVGACASHDQAANDTADHSQAQATSGAETADSRAAEAEDKTPREPHGDVPEKTRPGRLASDVPGAVKPGDAVEDTEAAPDNTAVNERDRDNATLTPGDQSNTERDLDITKRIRETVVDNDSLSFTAKNVKIITVDGRVTLRGPVKNEQERRAIEQAAVAVAGRGQVSNEIEIR
jgi:hyperosmotically inducible protein